MTTDLYQRRLDKIMEYAAKDHPTVVSYQKIVEMLNRKIFHTVLGVAFIFAAAIGSAGSTRAQTMLQSESQELERYRTAERIGQDHLRKFDTLDFDIYTNQKWERFKENHSPDILVHYPDGHTTKGLEAHIAELKPQFVFAPDTRIREHLVKISVWRMDLGDRRDGGDIFPADADAERANRTNRQEIQAPDVNSRPLGEWRDE